MKTTKLQSFLRRIVCVLAAACLIAAAFPIGAYASDPLTNYLEGWPQMTDINEDAACVIDADNLGVMYSLNRDDKMYPASITKIMTALVVLDNANLTDTVTMNQESTVMSTSNGTANQLTEAFTRMGQISAVIPRIAPMLNTQLP